MESYFINRSESFSAFGISLFSSMPFDWENAGVIKNNPVKMHKAWHIDLGNRDFTDKIKCLYTEFGFINYKSIENGLRIIIYY